MFWWIFLGDRVFGLVFEKSIIIHLRLHMTQSTPEDFTNFSSVLGGTFCWISPDDLGLPREFCRFFFVKDLKMKIQTLNEQARKTHGWMVWDGMGSDTTNPTLVGLDPFSARDDGMFTRKDGLRMIQKLKQPVENALTTVFSQVVVESVYLLYEHIVNI